MPDELTTKQAAETLGVTPRRVLQLIYNKRLPAEKHGRDWAIKAEDLELVRNRKIGRPSREKTPEELEAELPIIPRDGTVAIMIRRRPSSFGDETES
jgi:excisionase family DNA binding protein